ncbi:hypothetical protein ACIA5D_27640 [Actinoplanes sp. NPDC051513]|uniref:hypothetical protein n=1 Tax=Actinoplanes sp. NPDC051513 TaxID=3363908 RepID=UPI00379E59D7
MRIGLLAEATPQLGAARALWESEGDPLSEAIALLQLAEIRLYVADPAAAAELLRRATALLPPGEDAIRVRVRTGLGQALVQLPYAEACLAMGDRDAAARHFRAALEIATAHGIDYLASAAGDGLARVSRPVPGHSRNDRPTE